MLQRIGRKSKQKPNYLFIMTVILSLLISPFTALDFANASDEVVSTSNPVIQLPYTATDAVIDPNQPVIYISSKTEKKVYAVNYLTGEQSVIDFVYMPERLELGQGTYTNELYVSLLSRDHSSYGSKADQFGAIGVIDRDSFTQTEILDIDVDPWDIVAGRDGFLYVPSGSGQWTDIAAYDRAAKVKTARSTIRQQSFATLHPTLDRIYTVNTDTSPRDYRAYNISNGTFTDPAYPGGYDSPYHGDYPLNTYFNIDPAGKYLFNGSGTIFNTASDKASDMMYVAKLADAFNGITFDIVKPMFYTAPTADKAIYAYNYDSFEKVSAIALDGTGKYIFNDGQNLVVLVQPTTTIAGYQMGIQTISLQPAAITSVTLKANLTSPQPIEVPVTFTANAAGGLDPECQFWVSQAGGAWEMIQDWSGLTTCTWTPHTPGSAEIRVDARAKGSSSAQASQTISYQSIPVIETGTWLMPTEVNDTLIDPVNTVIYMTSREQRKLTALNYITGETMIHNFFWKPESLEFGKGNFANELYVALLGGNHSDNWWKEDQFGQIDVIDRSTLQTTDSINTQVDPYDIIAGRDGYLYVPSGSGQWTNFDSYNRSTKELTSRSTIRNLCPAILHPIFDRIYTINTDTSPRDYRAYNISNGSFTDASYPGGYDSPYHGDYPLNVYFNIDPAGKYLYNGSGTIFNAASDKASDMTYSSTLPYTFTGMAFDPQLPKFSIITPSDNKVHSLNSATYAEVASYLLPAPGKFIFNKGNNLVVLMQSASSQPYSIYIIKPVTSVTLNQHALSLITGGTTATLTVGVAPADATNKNVKWSSSNPAVATVAEGVVSPLSEGTTTITATTDDGSLKDSCVVTVKTINVKLSVTPVSPQRILTYVKLSAVSTGLTKTQYKFWISKDGGAWKSLRTWSTTSTASWIPTATGTYTLKVEARSGSTGTVIVQNQLTYIIKSKL